jgi:hypothetical protein
MLFKIQFRRGERPWLPPAVAQCYVILIQVRIYYLECPIISRLGQTYETAWSLVVGADRCTNVVLFAVRYGTSCEIKALSLCCRVWNLRSCSELDAFIWQC